MTKPDLTPFLRNTVAHAQGWACAGCRLGLPPDFGVAHASTPGGRQKSSGALDRVRALCHECRRAAPEHAPSLRNTVAHRQGWKCKCCRARLPPNFDVDHVVPRCKGGGNAPANLQALCHKCHGEKNQREMLERLHGIVADVTKRRQTPALVLKRFAKAASRAAHRYNTRASRRTLTLAMKQRHAKGRHTAAPAALALSRRPHGYNTRLASDARVRPRHALLG